MCNAHALALALRYKCSLALALALALPLRYEGALARALFDYKSSLALVGKKFILLL